MESELRIIWVTGSLGLLVVAGFLLDEEFTRTGLYAGVAIINILGIIGLSLLGGIILFVLVFMLLDSRWIRDAKSRVLNKDLAYLGYALKTDEYDREYVVSLQKFSPPATPVNRVKAWL